MSRSFPRGMILGGEFRHGAPAQSIANGFRSLGWNVQEVNTNDNLLIGDSIPAKALARFLASHSAAEYNRAVIKAADRLQASLVLFIKGNLVSPTTLEQLRARGILSAIYYPDYHFDYPNLDFSVVKNVDVLFTTKSFQLPFLEEQRDGRPTAFVAHGYAQEVHHAGRLQPREEDYVYDIAYVGNADSAKAEVMIEVARRQGHRKICVIGNRWTQFAQGTPLAPFVAAEAIHGDFMATIHRLSRINLGIHMKPHPTTGWQDTVSRRAFEIPASRGFMLHVDNPDVRSLYEVGKEIDVFDSVGELDAKIDYYLPEAGKRAEMVHRAFERAVPAYSHGARAREMAVLLEPLLSPPAARAAP